MRAFMCIWFAIIFRHWHRFVDLLLCCLSACAATLYLIAIWIEYEQNRNRYWIQFGVHSHSHIYLRRLESVFIHLYDDDIIHCYTNTHRGIRFRGWIKYIYKNTYKSVVNRPVVRGRALKCNAVQNAVNCVAFGRIRLAVFVCTLEYGLKIGAYGRNGWGYFVAREGGGRVGSVWRWMGLIIMNGRFCVIFCLSIQAYHFVVLTN